MSRHRLTDWIVPPVIVPLLGLASISANCPVLYERAAIYVDKSLKGTNPVSLPVEQSSKFQVTVNNKTAVCTENLSSGVVVVKSTKDGV